MKFSKYIKKLDEMVGSGTGAGQAGGPGFQSGDMPSGGDIATYSRRLFNDPVRRKYPKTISYEDTFKKKKRK